MTYIEQAIKEAVEKGGYVNNAYFMLKSETNKRLEANTILLDPLFWQALGKARGWGSSFGFIRTSDTGEIESWLESDSAGTVYQWRYYWHRFIDHLASGGDAELFFKELMV